jgi:hypothetical protein
MAATFHTWILLPILHRLMDDRPNGPKSLTDHKKPTTEEESTIVIGFG